MAGTRDTYRIARVVLTALAVALVVSVGVTYLIGASKLSTAEAEASDSARVLAQENLATYVIGDDLVAPVGDARAREIDLLIDDSIMNGEIDAVTIWDPDGTIVYSSDADLIGTRLPEERFRLREILKSGTASTVQDGMFSTRVPLAPAGTDADAVAQLDRVYAPLWDSTAKPWRTASLSLCVALLAVLGAIYQVSRMASRRWKVYAGTTFQAMRGRRPAALGGGDDGTDPAYAHPDFRKAEEEMARAEVRATTAEERAAALQEQYRKTLEELHAAQTKLEGAALETPSRPDPEIEERLLKAEGRVRLLEGQLQSVKGERDKLASDAQARPQATPDPKIEQRAREAEAETVSLRAELDTARREVAGVVKELEATRREREQLAARTADTGQVQAAERRAVEAERRIAELQERSRSLEADLTQARAVADGRIDEAQAAAEARTTDAEARAIEAETRTAETQVALAEAEHRASQIEATASEAEARATQAQAALAETEARAAQMQAALTDAEARASQAETFAAQAETHAAEAQAAATEATERIAAAEGSAAARMREIEAAATGDVNAAVAQLQAANARADEAQAALDAATGQAAQIQSDLEAAQRDTAAARAEAESFRATAGTARAELEDAFRAELESREQELRLDAEAREAEMRRAAEAREAELRTAAETRERALRDQAEAEAKAVVEQAHTELETLRDRARSEMQTLQEQSDARVQELTERLADVQAQAQTIAGREQQLVGHLEARDHDLAALHTREAELVAELAALQEETREQLDAREQELRRHFAEEQTASFAKLQAATQAEAVRFETERAELESREATLRAELDQLRTRLEGTTSDLGTTGSELETVRAELERARAEADGSRAELQTVWGELESAQQELTTAIEQARSRESDLEAVRAEAQALRDGTADADGALTKAQEEVELLRRELTDARDDLVRTQGDVQTELARGSEIAARSEAAERELQEASMRAAAAEHELEQLRREAEIASGEVTSLREIADAQAVTAQEREALEEMLRVTQEHLNGSNDRATEIETRAQAAEMALTAAREEVEELESRLRQIEMSQAVRAMRREDAESTTTAEAPIEVGEPAAIEDRRASTPFMKELSLDAKKSLTSILGLSLTLKHKSQPKEQAPLLRQLAAYARRLDHTVADLLDADKLARGEVELHLRRTDLEALVERVVEESQVGNDHDVRLQTERIIASVDPVRTEQILMGLLRGATDRTPLGSAITIRLSKGEGGALISVEDAETSSDASLSPVVARFADIQGGWAKVESRPNGGSAFRVFLPAEGVMPDSPADGADPEIELSVSAPRTDLEIVVSDELDTERRLVAAAADDDDPWAAGQLLVQELQKLSRDD
jgi:chromosome segregation ATPase